MSKVRLNLRYFLCLSLAVWFINTNRLLQDSRPEISKLTFSGAKQTHHLSREKGFNPIYVYSNRKTAQSEVPKISDANHFKGDIGNGLTGQPYSQVKQDLIASALSEANWELEKKTSTHSTRKRHFFFLDLAANHALLLSNTLYLEQQGWNGICIEGNPEYWYELGRYRSCTIVGAFVGGVEENDGQQVDIALRSAFGGIVDKNFDNKESKHIVKRDLVSISTILNDAECPEVIDYFSLDVEGAESFVMKDFPWNKYTFRFMTIERPKDDLVKLLKSHGYTMYKNNLSDWGETLWSHKSVKLSENEIEKILMSI